LAAKEIRKNPQNMTEILDEFYTEEEVQAQEQQQAAAQPEPDIASVLSQLGGGLPPEQVAAGPAIPPGAGLV
jgi:hypothetical protein